MNNGDILFIWILSFLSFFLFFAIYRSFQFSEKQEKRFKSLCEKNGFYYDETSQTCFIGTSRHITYEGNKSLIDLISLCDKKF